MMSETANTDLVDVSPDCREQICCDSLLPALGQERVWLAGYSRLKTRYRIERRLGDVHCFLLTLGGEGEVRLGDGFTRLPVGEWVHVSNNLHVYEHHFELIRGVQPDPHLAWMSWPGRQPLLTPDEDHKDFDQDCLDLVAGSLDDFRTEFFDQTVAPMVQAYHKHKAGDHDGAKYDASCIEANDWRKASLLWLKGAKK